MTNPLDRLAALLWDGHSNQWKARARGSNVFVSHADPEEAVLMAIKEHDEHQVPASHQANLEQQDR